MNLTKQRLEILSILSKNPDGLTQAQISELLDNPLPHQALNQNLRRMLTHKLINRRKPYRARAANRGNEYVYRISVAGWDLLGTQRQMKLSRQRIDILTVLNKHGDVIGGRTLMKLVEYDKDKSAFQQLLRSMQQYNLIRLYSIGAKYPGEARRKISITKHGQEVLREHHCKPSRYWQLKGLKKRGS